jgi:plastocyanin
MRYIALMLIPLLLIAACTTTPPKENTVVPSGNTVVKGGTTQGGDAPAEMGKGSVVTFDLEGKTFRFYQNGQESPKLTVKQGDTVRINLKVSDMMHDFVIDEIPGARTAQGKTGETVTAEFVATTPGTFEYYCSVGQHRANGMKGTFIVQ